MQRIAYRTESDAFSGLERSFLMCKAVKEIQQKLESEDSMAHGSAKAKGFAALILRNVKTDRSSLPIVS